MSSATHSESATPLDELRAQVLPLAKLVVTHWGYLRPDARDNTSLSGMFFIEADALLNPIFGSPEQAHRAVLNALAGSEGSPSRSDTQEVLP